ncbi:HesB/IscA family protein [Gorillibacterium sp. sgz500922]|uniref:HesB/IscA family protein n=1 Tax=Gorillibacterium sp. sgz500922 TaxID=3446694 RepID=UPI003F66CA56
MNAKITRNAAKVIQKELDKEENKELKLRVMVTHKHGDHAHYAMDLDLPGEHDDVVETDKGIALILDRREPLLDGVKVDYLFFPQEGFVVTNPSKGNHGDH